MTRLLTISFLLIFISADAQKVKADDILGTWIAGEGKAKVSVFKSGTKYFGKIIWLKEPLKNGKQKTDIHNPDPHLRSKPVIDLVVLKNFEFEDGEWVNGRVYDPSSGNDYSCKITMPNLRTLKVRGFIGISLLGKTDVWKRN